MGCSCKDNVEDILREQQRVARLRELFIKRMTEDSETQDRRRKDYNQAIFSWFEEDEKEADPSKTFPCWEPMDMGMVLQCFDDATKDLRKDWCDVEDCRRKPRKWKKDDYGSYIKICSVCGRKPLATPRGEPCYSDFCPHCGTKMNGEGEK